MAADKCQEFWGGFVKNSDNPDGSRLKPGADIESVVRVVGRYADAVAEKID